MGAQGRRGTCRLAGVLPPWHDRCHGSRVWHDFLFVGEPRPPFGDGPHGSRKGHCPLTPDCALCAQGRRETCCLAGVLPPLGGGPRGSPVWHDFLFVGEPRPPFGDGPHGSLQKASVDLISRWPLAWQKSQAAPLHPPYKSRVCPTPTVPRAFFGTFFRFERKYDPPGGGSPTVRAVVGASNP